VKTNSRDYAFIELSNYQTFEDFQFGTISKEVKVIVKMKQLTIYQKITLLTKRTIKQELCHS